MVAIINIAYIAMFLVFIMLGLFVVFHIVRYSYNQALSALMLIIFISVFSSLLLANIALFHGLNWESIISSAFKIK